MILRSLLEEIGLHEIKGSESVEITGISYDSRGVKAGHLFAAMRGEHVDGHGYIGDAVSRGAAAILYDRTDLATSDFGTATAVRVGETREALATASHIFFGRPSHLLKVIGVTGTNGKTTTTYIVKSILESWGQGVGLVGTIRYMIRDLSFEAPHTTPEAPDFQSLLAEMIHGGCGFVVSEISSHALSQKRVDATRFSAAVFTNLTRDHLDYHGTMEEYFQAKRRLFTDLIDAGATSVVNADDPWGRRLLEDLKGRTVTFGLESGDLVATDISDTFEGLRFGLLFQGQRHDVISPLVGLPNVYNILSAVAVTASLGVPWEVIIKGVRTAGHVPGRFEKVDEGQEFLAVVDYAHTEDALERLLYTARGITKGRVITVFGCGGDRDRGKRPGMGAIATRLSDFVILTSDNPRTEDPSGIIREIEAGALRKNYLVEEDRGDGIARAVMMAQAGDVVLVAGKGHEAYQEIGARRFPFSDRESLREAIRRYAGKKA